jgi:hypothetical protein
VGKKIQKNPSYSNLIGQNSGIERENKDCSSKVDENHKHSSLERISPNDSSGFIDNQQDVN